MTSPHRVLLASIVAAFVLSANANEEVRTLNRSLHGREVEVIRTQTNAAGQVSAITNRYEEVQVGMHFLDAEGNLQESKPEFAIAAEGHAEAKKMQTPVKVPPNIHNGIIEVTGAGGETYKTRIWGLAYYDTLSGESVVLAQIKPSVGALLPDKSRVLYENAFDEPVLADVRLDITPSKYEQNVILRRQLPSPQLWNLPEAYTYRIHRVPGTPQRPPPYLPRKQPTPAPAEVRT